jgi:hypothetical protein
LVNKFNRETSHNGWSGRRGAFLDALFVNFEEREIDLQNIFELTSGFQSLSLKYPVFLDISNGKKKLFQITNAWRNSKSN